MTKTKETQRDQIIEECIKQIKERQWDIQFGHTVFGDKYIKGFDKEEEEKICIIFQFDYKDILCVTSHTTHEYATFEIDPDCISDEIGTILSLVEDKINFQKVKYLFRKSRNIVEL